MPVVCYILYVLDVICCIDGLCYVCVCVCVCVCACACVCVCVCVTESVLVLIVTGKWHETPFVVTLASVECGWELCV